MTETNLIHIVSDALARRAGWFSPRREGLPQPLCRALNNPGLLNAWRRNMAGEFEDTGLFESFDTACGGFIQFPDVKTGWLELYRSTRLRITRQRVTARRLFITRDDTEFLNSLTARLGIQPDQILADLITEVPHGQRRGNTRMASKAVGRR